MSYHRTALGGLGPEHVKALEVEPAAIRALPVDRRLELALMHADNEARKREAFWGAVQASLTVLAFFGITRWGK